MILRLTLSLLIAFSPSLGLAALKNQCTRSLSTYFDEAALEVMDPTDKMALEEILSKVFFNPQSRLTTSEKEWIELFKFDEAVDAAREAGKKQGATKMRHQKARKNAGRIAWGLLGSFATFNIYSRFISTLVYEDDVNDKFGTKLEGNTDDDIAFVWKTLNCDPKLATSMRNNNNNDYDFIFEGLIERSRNYTSYQDERKNKNRYAAKHAKGVIRLLEHGMFQDSQDILFAKKMVKNYWSDIEDNNARKAQAVRDIDYRIREVGDQQDSLKSIIKELDIKSNRRRRYAARLNALKKERAELWKRKGEILKPFERRTKKLREKSEIQQDLVLKPKRVIFTADHKCLEAQRLVAEIWVGFVHTLAS